MGGANGWTYLWYQRRDQRSTKWSNRVGSGGGVVGRLDGVGEAARVRPGFGGRIRQSRPLPVLPVLSLPQFRLPPGPAPRKESPGLTAESIRAQLHRARRHRRSTRDPSFLPTPLAWRSINAIRALSPWTRWRRRSPATRGRRWRWPRRPTCSGLRFLPPRSRGTPTGPTATDSCCRAATRSMLLYALLHLTGYDLSLDDLKQFRQWGVETPGHPGARPHARRRDDDRAARARLAATAVGMATADRFLARVQQARPPVIDYRIWRSCVATAT